MQHTQREQIAVKVLANEQRLTMTLMGYWQSLRREDGCPRIEDFDAGVVPHYQTDCFVLCRVGSTREWECRTVGRNIAARSQITYLPQTVSGIAPGTLLYSAVQMLEATLESSRPNIAEGEFVDRREGRCLYRSILLPFVDRKLEVALVLGGARCKAVQAGVR